jgi:hypothetical protein
MSKWFVFRALAALVLVGLLIAGGPAVYRVGWLRGYAAGQLAIESGEGEVTPYALPGFGHPGWHFSFPSLLIGAGVFFLLLIVLGNLFRWLIWRKVMAEGPWRWARHWHRFHGPFPYAYEGEHSGPFPCGPVPPWCWGWEKPAREESSEAEPGAQTSPRDADTAES